MNEDEIIEITKRSGLGMLLEVGGMDKCLEHFAKLVAEREREQSSKVGDYNRGWNDCLFASGIEKQSQRTWVGLTDKDIEDCYVEELYLFAVALEAKLKEKNS